MIRFDNIMLKQTEWFIFLMVFEFSDNILEQGFFTSSNSFNIYLYV